MTGRAWAATAVVLAALVGVMFVLTRPEASAPPRSAGVDTPDQAAVARTSTERSERPRSEHARVELGPPAAESTDAPDADRPSEPTGGLEDLGPLSEIDQAQIIARLAELQRSWEDRVVQLNELASESNPKSLRDLAEAMYHAKAFARGEHAIRHGSYRVHPPGLPPPVDDAFVATTPLRDETGRIVDVSLEIPFDVYPEIREAADHLKDMEAYYRTSRCEEFNALGYETRKNAFESFQRGDARSKLRQYLGPGVKVDSMRFRIHYSR